MKYKDLMAILLLCCVTGCSNIGNPVSNDNKEPVSRINNSPPVITALTFTPDTIQAGESCLVQCDAVDQDNDNLMYEWEATGNISRSGAKVFFTPSACCAYPRIIVTIKDGYGGSTDSVIFVPIKF